jgi:hypothetical protein
VHCGQCPGGREALADTAEVDGCACLDPRAPGIEVDLDLGTGSPPVARAAVPLLELVEAAVVAGRDERSWVETSPA